MDRVILTGSDFACRLLGLVESSGLRVSLCYNTEGNRYAMGIGFWVVTALLVAAVTAGYRKVDEAH